MLRTGRMERVIEGTAFKGLIVLAGILAISTVMQFTVWNGGSELADIMLAQLSGGPDSYEPAKAKLYDAMGFDRPFMPDLWPFDNESLWRRTPSEDR